MYAGMHRARCHRIDAYPCRRELPSEADREGLHRRLAALPVVLYEPGGNTRRVVDEWFARAGLRPKPVMEPGSVEAIKQLVGAGLGCAVLPSMALPRSEDGGSIVARPLSPKLHRKLGLVLRGDKPLHRGLREMLALLTLRLSGDGAPAISAGNARS